MTLPDRQNERDLYLQLRRKISELGVSQLDYRRHPGIGESLVDLLRAIPHTDLHKLPVQYSMG